MVFEDPQEEETDGEVRRSDGELGGQGVGDVAERRPGGDLACRVDPVRTLRES